MRVGAALILALVGLEARAIPAFARRYETSCLTCHAGAPPSLNAYGRQMLEGGLQLPQGAEEPVREEKNARLGTLVERLALPVELPLSVRAQGSVVLGGAEDASGQRGVAVRPIENLLLSAGASLFRDVAFFATAELAPAPQLHHATMGVHNLFGEERLNLRAGQLLLFDFLRPEHRELARVGNPAGAVRVGKNPTAVDATHLGVEAYGRLFSRRLFWHVAVVEGGRVGLIDLDANQDYFAQLQVAHLGFGAGLFGYFGRTQLLDRSFATAVRYTDPFRVTGGFVEVVFQRATLYGLLLHGRHENPDGWNAPREYVGARAQVDLLLEQQLLATVRYDAVYSADAALAKEHLTSMVSYLALTNLRVAAELSTLLRDPPLTEGRLSVEVMF